MSNIALERLTISDAQRIAEAELSRKMATGAELRYSDFEPPRALREDAETWTFAAPSPQAIEDGLVPGALFILVDKKDGHVWTTEELERYLIEKQGRAA